MIITTVTLPQPISFNPGEYFEIQVTRLIVGQPHSVIYKTIIDPSNGYRTATIEAIDFRGEIKS